MDDFEREFREWMAKRKVLCRRRYRRNQRRLSPSHAKKSRGFARHIRRMKAA